MPLRPIASSTELSDEKARLLVKVADGTATRTELRQLRSLCMLDGDRACRRVATTALKKFMPLPLP
jgi:hypothetical protein